MQMHTEEWETISEISVWYTPTANQQVSKYQIMINANMYATEPTHSSCSLNLW